MTSRRQSFRVQLTESIRYSVDVAADDANHARKVTLALWHNHLQAFRPITDGELSDIVVEPVEGSCQQPATGGAA